MESGYYIPLTQSFLEQGARQQYGSQAKLVQTIKTAYGWAVSVNGQIKPLDIQAEVTRVYGAAFRALMVHFGPDGWRAFNTLAPYKYVAPVIFIANEFLRTEQHVLEINWAIYNFTSVLNAVVAFYRKELGKTMKMLTPTLVGTHLTAADWIEICRASEDSTGLTPEEAAQRRGLLTTRSMELYNQYVRRTSPDLHYLFTSFTGNTPWNGKGPAAIGTYCAVPSVVCCLDVAANPMDTHNREIMYLTTHEVGHTLGLPHPTDYSPVPAGYENSVMQRGYPMDAILLDLEKEKIRNHPVFA